MRAILQIILLFCLPLLSLAQESYDQCGQALELCPGSSVQINNFNATKSLCANCEDDFTSCFTANNTIWITFKTNNTGGNVQFTASNITYSDPGVRAQIIQGVLFSTPSPCTASNYTIISNCEANGINQLNLQAVNLAANTTYYIVLNGGANQAANLIQAEFTAQISISGPGVDRLPPALVMSSHPSLNDSLCPNQSILIQGGIVNCPDNSPLKWYINNELIGVSNDLTFQLSSMKNGDILSVVTNCYLECPIEIIRSSPPIKLINIHVDAGPSISLFKGKSGQLQGATNTSEYYWTPTFNMNNPTILNPVVAPSETTIYYLTAKRDHCEVSDSTVVTIFEDLKIVNTFSPNGDGVNDTWEILGLDDYPNCRLSIFDRWGNEVYETTGYTDKKFWDGKRNGSVLSAGVYFYTLDLRSKDKPEIIKGYVTLIR